MFEKFAKLRRFKNLEIFLKFSKFGNVEKFEGLIYKI